MMFGAACLLALPGTRAGAATLSDSIHQAVQTHPLVAAGKASAAAAGHSVKEQRAVFYPTVSINANAGRLHANNDTTRGIVGGDAYSWTGGAGISLTQPLFAGFGNVNRLEAAKGRAASATYDLGGATEDVAVRAARAHLNMMRTRELMDLNSGYVAEIEKRRDSIALMVSEGAADEAELLQADEIMMAAKTTRLGYEESFQQAVVDYVQVVGIEPGDKLEFGEAVWEKFVPGALEEAMDAARKNNPKLQAADSMVAALARDMAAEKAGLLPKVDAELSYNETDQNDEVGGETMSAQAMVRLSWGISTGGGQLARINRGVRQREEALAKRQNLLRTIDHDVRQRFTSMKIVDEQFGVMVNREEASRKILDNFLTQYEGGKQTNLQLISAHSRLFDARAARTDAYYRRLLTRFELLSAMGRLEKALDVTGPVRTGESRAVESKAAENKTGEMQ
jgi:outer membrane protein, adhesin transport system